MTIINGDAGDRIAWLVTELQNGNMSVFRELYDLTHEKAFGVAKMILGNIDDAEDVLQESYVKALSKIRDLDKPEKFRSWFNQIVTNKCKDFFRKKKPSHFDVDDSEVYDVLPDEDTVFKPEENLDQDELHTAIMEALDELNEEKRACILMMYFEDLSVKEIAGVLEIPEGTVKTRLSSARKTLKDKLEEREITSAYSVAPMGVVLWAMRRSIEANGARFAASGASAKVFAGITASGVLTATGTAAAVTGGGIAAKIAALTVAQKVIAGVSVAAVVIGGTVGVATVADKKSGNSEATTAYTEEFTTAPYDGTTIAFQAVDSTVEFTLTQPSATNGATASSSGQTSATQAGTATSTKPVSTTRQTTAKPTEAKQTTAKPNTTRASTTKSTTAKPNTTKPTATKPTTTKSTATKPTSTKPTTTVPTTKGTATVTVSIIGLDGKPTGKPVELTVEAGTELDKKKIWAEVEAKGNIEVSDIYGGSFGITAQAGKTYSFKADLFDA